MEFMNLFHATPEAKLDKILSEGLKTGCPHAADALTAIERNESCSELLYFTDTKENAVLFAKEFLRYPWQSQGAWILKVDSEDIPEDSCYEFARAKDRFSIDNKFDVMVEIPEIIYKGYGKKPCVIPPDKLEKLEYVPPY